MLLFQNTFLSKRYYGIVFQLGDDSKDVKVGDLIALMVAEGEDWNDVQVPGKKKTKSPVATQEIQKSKIESQTTSEPIARHSQ